MDNQEQNNASEGQKSHLWTDFEDDVLVDCLVEMKMEGSFVADTGFNAGYVTKLEEMLKEKIPGTQLKAHPNIWSRLRTLKKQWQAIHNLIYGPNTSGFGWDPVNKCVEAEDAVWEEYVKRNSKAGKYRNRKFRHFEKLTFVWGKDRATGNSALRPDQAQEEAQQEARENEEAPENDQADPAIDHNVEIDQSQVQTTSAKRHRTSRDAAEMLCEAMKESSKMMIQVSENICKSFIESRRESSHIKASQELYAELLKIEELTDDEIDIAHLKIAASPTLMMGFPLIPDERKANWIRRMIN